MQVFESTKETDDKKHQQAAEVTVDGVKKAVKRGEYLVSAFKAMVGVDASLALDEVVKGEFRELKDDEKIKIKGGEQFVSHVRGGGSAHG